MWKKYQRMTTFHLWQVQKDSFGLDAAMCEKGSLNTCIKWMEDWEICLIYSSPSLICCYVSTKKTWTFFLIFLNDQESNLSTYAFFNVKWNGSLHNNNVIATLRDFAGLRLLPLMQF